MAERRIKDGNKLGERSTTTGRRYVNGQVGEKEHWHRGARRIGDNEEDSASATKSKRSSFEDGVGGSTGTNDLHKALAGGATLIVDFVRTLESQGKLGGKILKQFCLMYHASVQSAFRESSRGLARQTKVAAAGKQAQLLDLLKPRLSNCSPQFLRIDPVAPKLSGLHFALHSPVSQSLR